MTRRKRHRRILKSLETSGWCVELCYVACREFAIKGWRRPFSEAVSPSLPPFRNAEHRLVFVLRSLDCRRRVVLGWKELSRFSQNERKWKMIKH